MHYIVSEKNSNTAHTRRQRLLQLDGLLSVIDTQCVEVLGAANLELDSILAPLDPHGAGILPPRCEKEVLDLMDLLRLPSTIKSQNPPLMTKQITIPVQHHNITIW